MLALGVLVLNPAHFPFFVAVAQEFNLAARGFAAGGSNLSSPVGSTGGDGGSGGGGGGSGGSLASSPAGAKTSLWGLSSPRSAAAGAVIAGGAADRFLPGGGSASSNGGVTQLRDVLRRDRNGTTLAIGAGLRSDGGAVTAKGSAAGEGGSGSPSAEQQQSHLPASPSPSESLLHSMGSGAPRYLAIWKVLERVRNVDPFRAVAEAAATVVQIVVDQAKALASARTRAHGAREGRGGSASHPTDDVAAAAMAAAGAGAAAAAAAAAGGVGEKGGAYPADALGTDARR